MYDIFLQECVRFDNYCHIFIQGNVTMLLDKKDETESKASYCKDFDLEHVLDRNVDELSGGELQRFACAVVCVQNADV